MRRFTTALLAALVGSAIVPAAAFAADGGEINSGDTAWMLASTALVMIILPGLALFYGGLVRRKNVLSTIMHSFFGLAIVSVVWVLIGFSLAFGPDVNGWGLVGNLDYVGFFNVGLTPSAVYATTIPFVLFASFQLMFAAITPEARPLSEIADRAVTEEVVRLLRQHRAAGSKRAAGLLAEPGAIADSFWVVVPHELSTEAGEVRIPASTARSVAPALATPLQPIRSRDAIATRG